MDESVHTRIDPDKCVGCGLCIHVCPQDTISIQGDRAAVTGDRSIGCGHCAAACPEGAITVDVTDPLACKLESVESDNGYIQPGTFDIAALFRLMRSRRSCRNYLNKPVSMAMLKDLVRIGISAPSGTNSQAWTFTLVPERAAVLKLARAVAEFFRSLNRKARNPILRLMAKVLMKDALGEYFRDYYPIVTERLRQFDQEGRDSLFHGAPALILVGATPEASTPIEDALLASQNIQLGAHAMGLGTCLVGFAVEAIRHQPAIRRLIQLPEGEKIHAVITVGYPDEKFVRTAQRKPCVPRILEL